MKKQQQYELIDLLREIGVKLTKIEQKLDHNNKKMDESLELKTNLIQSVDAFDKNLAKIETFVETLGKVNDHIAHLPKINEEMSKTYAQNEKKNELLSETLKEIQ